MYLRGVELDVAELRPTSEGELPRLNEAVKQQRLLFSRVEAAGLEVVSWRETGKILVNTYVLGYINYLPQFESAHVCALVRACV